MKMNLMKTNSPKMMKQSIANSLFRHIILLLLLATGSAFASDFMSQLQAADIVRSSNPSLFSSKLTAIRKHLPELSTNEFLYLQYLTGYELAFNGEILAGVEQYKEILDSNANNNLKLRAELSIVNEYAILKNWEDGLKYLSSALKQQDSITDQNLKVMSFTVAALFYNALGQYELAKEYAEQLINQTELPRQKCLASQLLVESKSKLDELSATSDEFLASKTQCNAANEVVMASIIVATQAELFLKDNQPKQAIKLLEAQFPELQKVGYKTTIGVFYALLSEAYWTLGQEKNAYNHAQKAVAILKIQAPLNGPKTRAYKVLYEYYRSHGDDTAALDAYINYAEADKANLDEIKTKTMAYQLVQHQNIEQQSRITLLNQQNRVLTLQQKLAKNESRTQRDLIVALMCVIALLIFSAVQSWRNQCHFRKLAEYDGLTNIFSRAHFTAMAHQLLQHSQQHQESVSCVMFDIDHFKQINDSKGHKTGDWVLRNAAQSSRQLCRHNDLLGRVGGEEFCILLPQTNLKQAKEMAELLRQRLSTLYTSDSGYDFSLTASFGVSDTSTSGYKLEGLMHDADQAMYQAKSSGRNRVCCFVVNECNSLENETPLTPSQSNQL
ncbi:tetratricopeptide repeat-containing diguanylate cyclase [Shewanella sp.]|uniref:tetratricopeptide repeat-containing diguanylate cyclase n=1 Tax=Shewanella sp. TaxID=50422 RepID=UPI003D0FDCE5